MSVGASGSPAGAGLPPVDRALQPTWVRNGSEATQKAYALAQGFEEMLVGELSQSIATTSGLGGEGSLTGMEDPETGEGQAAGTGPMTSELSSLLPQALSAGLIKAGGIGLAAQLTRELEPPGGGSQVTAGGGTRA